MDEKVKSEFLRKRMVELREKNGISQSEMADKLFVNKSTLSRAESGSSSYKTICDFIEQYWSIIYDPEKLLEQSFSEEQIKRLPPEERQKQQEKMALQKKLQEQKYLFMRGERVVVTDTSALLKNIQLLDELSKEYSVVIVPSIVVDELTNIKNKNTSGLAAKAWQIILSIRSGNHAITVEYTGNNPDEDNDSKIIDIAREASGKYNCSVDVITYDADFAARLSGDTVVNALFLEDYIRTKQEITDISTLKKIDEYYADDYSNIESVLGIKIPSEKEINVFLTDGNTLIISVVRNRRHPIAQRKAKIRWLIEHGADVDKRDNARYYFPPLSHAVQIDDFDIFCFLLHECNANPNVGSKNPHDGGKLIQKNEGNMPLMIAAWSNRVRFVKELCKDSRISMNQQDGNGYTALIKACIHGNNDCRDILIEAGADQKIVDREGKTAEDRYNEHLENEYFESMRKTRGSHNYSGYGGGWNRR